MSSVNIEIQKHFTEWEKNVSNIPPWFAPYAQLKIELIMFNVDLDRYNIFMDVLECTKSSYGTMRIQGGTYLSLNKNLKSVV